MTSCITDLFSDFFFTFIMWQVHIFSWFFKIDTVTVYGFVMIYFYFDTGSVKSEMTDRASVATQSDDRKETKQDVDANDRR